MKKAKLISVAAAIVMASSTAATVSAIDYGTINPLVTRPGNTGPTPAPANPAGSASTSSSAESTVVSANSVARAVASGKAIAASYKNAEIKSNAMAALAKKAGGELNVNTKRFSVNIAADSVSEVKDINLGLKITKNSKRNALVIRTVQKDAYGCTVKFMIPEKIYSQAGVDTDNAKVYAIVDGKAQLLDNVQVDEDGCIVLEIAEGGSFIVM